MELSIISPVFKNADSLEELIERTTNAVRPYVKEWEFILVVDGSPDTSLTILKQSAQINSKIKILSFTRNFGQHAAILAGLQYAQGEKIFILDADLEESPENFGDFFVKLNENYDLVVGIRQNRRSSKFKEWTANFYYKFQGWLTDYPLMPHATNMRLMTKKYKMFLLHFSERPFFGGFTVWVGGHIAQIPVLWVDRKRKSSFNITKLLFHSRLGILAFSSKLLRASSLFGIIISTISFMYGIVLIASYYFVKTTLPGFTSLATLLTFLLGIQCIFMGIIGEYIAEIFETVKHRPHYLINDAVNIEISDNKCVG